MIADSACFGTEEGLVRYVRSVFDLFDEDNSDTIEPEEFRKLCTELGYFFSNDELKTIFSIIDTDHSGTIEFDEFFVFWQSSDKFRLHDARQLQLYRAALAQFRQYDLDGNGQISIDEYREITKRCGWNSSEAEIEAAIKKLDKDGDGEISFEEYVEWLNWGL